MTLVEIVKAELCSLKNDRPCCTAWEIRGALDVRGVAPGRRVHLPTDSAPVARRLYSLLREAGASGVKLVRRPRSGFMVSAAWPDLLSGDQAEAGRPVAGPGPRCCRKAYVRGCFLVRGYLSVSARGYHWEIKAPGRAAAEAVASVVRRLGLDGARAGRWQNGWVVYIKDSDQISEWLRLIGAHEALLDFENTRVEKEMRNTVTRRVNYETANLARMVAAALRQKDDIRLIQRTMGLAGLPPGLRALAEARLAQPHASLAELGASLDPPLTKSGANHRMREISALAGKIRRELAARAGTRAAPGPDHA